MEPRPHPMADAEQQGVGVRVVRNVGVVRGEDRHAPLVVSRVDDEVHRLLDPLRGLLGAEVVEHEQIGAHHRPQHVELGGADRRIVGAPDDPKEIARVVKHAARTRRPHDLFQHRDGEVRLAHARRPLEEQTLADGGKGLGELTRLLRRVLERLSDRVVRETTTEIVLQVAERLVKEEIERIRASNQ